MEMQKVYQKVEKSGQILALRLERLMVENLAHLLDNWLALWWVKQMASMRVGPLVSPRVERMVL